jgi:hypothetical protein
VVFPHPLFPEIAILAASFILHRLHGLLLCDMDKMSIIGVPAAGFLKANADTLLQSAHFLAKRIPMVYIIVYGL